MKEFYFSTKGMTVGYDGVAVVKDVNIALKKGEILTLIGPNGAGKSTILKSIIGQLKLLGGTVILDGECLNKMSESELAKELSIVLTQRIRPELMTCKDVIETGRYPYTGRLGILSEEDKRIVDETISMVGVEELKEKEFLKLSDGQKQRVMLARAIAQEPEILILDEPTSYLDIRYKVEFLSLLQRMTKIKKLTVIMSLHELDLAERISDKILCVNGEYVERTGTPEEVFSPGFLSQVYKMKEGSFDEKYGSVELEKPEGEPRVFVIAGGGSAMHVFRRLQRKGIPFAAGILMENDQDTLVAKALASRLITSPAFEKMSQEVFLQAKEVMDGCETVICTLTEFKELNEKNKKLMEYAIMQGKLRKGEELWQK